MPCEADIGNFKHETLGIAAEAYCDDNATQYSCPHDDFQRTGYSLTLLSAMIVAPFMVEKD